MNISEFGIVGELVAQDYRAATVFKAFGIDFCCNGHRSIQEACEKGAVETAVVLDALAAALQAQAGEVIDYNAWPVDLLADYIEKKHHRYVRASTQEIRSYLEKIVKVHGAQHPELIKIEQLFSESAEAMAAHMKKEEFILFPFIRKMVAAGALGQKVEAPMFGQLQNPIAQMEHEHDDEGARFRRISELTNNYTPPQDACNTYQVAFALLKAFENDLHLHIHLENNILFPKVIKMEAALFST